MAALDVEALVERCKDEQRNFWVHIEASTPLEKYPAKQHAQRVAEKLGVTEGLIYLPGAPTVLLEDSDQPRPFRQRRYFYYMSGCDEPDCHLTYDIKQDALVLYIPEIDPKKVIWNATEKYDVDCVYYSNLVKPTVLIWPALNEKGNVYILHPSQGVEPGHDTKDRVDATKLQLAMDAARVRKDSHEIKLIRRANEISAEAHSKVLSNLLKFKNEAEVEAIFLDTCVSHDAKNQAYEIIAASGENASTLHYVKNDEPLAGRQLMCLDAGCEWQNYASDVTRTFPLSDANGLHRALEARVKFIELHYLAHRIAIEGLLALKILRNGTVDEIVKAGTSLAFFPHGLGHHMGLEVHDVSAVPLMSYPGKESIESSRVELEDTGLPPSVAAVYEPELCRAPTDPKSGALEEGMVVTVEPGIYFSRYALSTTYLPSPVHSKYINVEVLEKYLPVGGVRIEDDILVTERGYENLTTAPKGEEMLDLIPAYKPVESVVALSQSPGPQSQDVSPPTFPNISDGTWSHGDFDPDELSAVKAELRNDSLRMVTDMLDRATKLERYLRLRHQQLNQGSLQDLVDAQGPLSANTSRPSPAMAQAIVRKFYKDMQNELRAAFPGEWEELAAVESKGYPEIDPPLRPLGSSSALQDPVTDMAQQLQIDTTNIAPKRPEFRRKLRRYLKNRLPIAKACLRRNPS
ncbi:hypothetical protein H2199_007128 [Coniosporium tulheliwenetii]|uniref:Uncharacterized protein n=1 Tax=Coniosporium tulheliwenetii TaxID=3383036 RepID=A0ACC2YTF2_9PEZI|nr:hypothetical protein H2199_007128 [Cladosporium sp. JES 115]